MNTAMNFRVFVLVIVMLAYVGGR